MGKGVLLVVLLVVSVAQFLPSCGSGRENTVIGWVEEKRFYPARDNQYAIVINKIEYPVEEGFYFEVGIGDLVKYEGGVWTIVRKRGT